jgi:hypothetical protein
MPWRGLRFVLGGDVELATRPCRHLLEGLVLSLPIEVVAGRDAVAFSADLRPDDHELFGVRIREWREEARIDDRIYGSGGADADH